MKALSIIRRNETTAPERGRQSQKAQVDTPSCPDNRSLLPHLSTSIISDDMTEHLIGALVMKSLIHLERANSYG